MQELLVISGCYRWLAALQGTTQTEHQHEPRRSGQAMPGDINHVHLDTRSICEPDRFEVWRSYFRRTFLDIPDPSRARHFAAEGDIITRSDGVMFTAGQCEATDNHMSGDI